jgi:CDP-paratose 2-epimerase
LISLSSFVLKILISGICGFVGSVLAGFFRESTPGLEILGMDNLMRAGSETNLRTLGAMGIRVIHGDLRCASDFESLPAVDWVLDAAANPSVMAGVDGKSSSRQVVEHNLLGTVNMLEYCRRVSAGFILLSTSRVYSIPALASLPLVISGDRFAPDAAAPLPAGFGGAGIREDFSTAAPVSLYGATKLSSECLALEYGAAFDFPVRINRCSVMGGAGQFGTAEQGIFSYWLHAWREGRPLRYIGFDGRGRQVRDVFHPRDLGRLLLAQFQDAGRKGPPVINAGGGLANSMSLAELSAWCSDRFGTREVQSDPTPRPFDLPWIAMDNTTVSRMWQWEPEMKLPAVLESIAEHAAAHPEWLSLTDTR